MSLRKFEKNELKKISTEIETYIVTNWRAYDLGENVQYGKFIATIMKRYYRKPTDFRKEWFETFPGWEKYKTYKKVNNPLYMFLVWLSIQAFGYNEYVYAYNFLSLYLSAVYQTFLKKYFKRGIQESIYASTFRYLPNQHMFKQENGIGNSIKRIVKQISDNFDKKLIHHNAKDVYIFMLYCRDRLEQSYKSFAVKYYQIWNQDEDLIKKINSSNKFRSKIEPYVNFIIQHIYEGNYSKYALSFTSSLLQINNRLIKKIIMNIGDITYEQELKKTLYSIFMVFEHDFDRFRSEEGYKDIIKKMSAKNIKDTEHLRLTSKTFLFYLLEYNKDLELIYEKFSNNSKHKMESVIPLYLYFYSSKLVKPH